MIGQYLDFTKIFIEVEFVRDHDPIEIQNILFYEEKFNLFVLILGLQMKPKWSKLIFFFFKKIILAAPNQIGKKKKLKKREKTSQVSRHLKGLAYSTNSWKIEEKRREETKE